MDLRSKILLGCTLFALFPLARIVFLFGWREPRLARLVRSDYGEGVRLAERDFHVAAQFDNHMTADDFHYRDVTGRTAYMVDGEEFRSDVTLTVHKGDTVDREPIVWIDPANPEDATARGPGYWAQWLLLDLLIAVPAWWWLG